MVELSGYIFRDAQAILAEEGTESVAGKVCTGQFQLITVRRDAMVCFIVGASRKIKVVDSTGSQFGVDGRSVNSNNDIVTRYSTDNSIIGYRRAVSIPFYLL